MHNEYTHYLDHGDSQTNKLGKIKILLEELARVTDIFS